MQPPPHSWRLYTLLILLAVAGVGVLWRLVDLNLVNRSFLLKQSQARILRKVKISGYRGMITDRFGDPLAISTPVESVWVNPKLFKASKSQIHALADSLHLSIKYIKHRVRAIPGREFVYLKRDNSPAVSAKVRALKIPGVFFQREYRRYYPDGAVTAHVVGITNVDDQGQEGLELAYNNWLAGSAGEKEVLKDRLGRVIDNVALLKKPKQGHNLTLSLDQRIQFLAYRALKKVVNRYHADSGSVVVLDVKTGEILAMVNQPSYNPNRRPKDHDGRYRNRAVTDIFEPGSTIKTFNIVLALESGQYTPQTKINTHPGRLKIGRYVIKDEGLDYDKISLTQVLQKSSNIGAAKVMLSLKVRNYWDLLRKLGFGQRTRSGFPGEVGGILVSHETWLPSVVATLAYGYGIAVTTLQLAHAYAILANDGVKIPVTFLKVKQPPKGVRIIPAKIAKTVMKMLETVEQKGGTGTRARVPGYEVAGKTGTAYIAGPKGYYKHRYTSSFVGIAPVSEPRLVVAVVIRDPKGQHFGGIVSAPVFAKVMGGALRLLDVPPDNLQASRGEVKKGVIPLIAKR